MRRDAPLWKQAVAACVVLAALAAWQYGAYRSRLAAEAQQAALEAALKAATVPWAPVIDEVRSMSAWEVEGAGDESYNGVYEEAGELNGKPYYQYGAGETARYLFWGDFDHLRWNLDARLAATYAWAEHPAYTASVHEDLEEVTHLICVDGSPPAPTISLYAPEPAPPPQPDPNTGEEVPGPPTPIVGRQLPCEPVRPCRMDIGGVNHIIVFLGFQSVHYATRSPGIVLFNAQTRQWRRLTSPLMPTVALPAQWQPQPTLLPAGGGETVWLVTHPAGHRVRKITAWSVALDPAVASVLSRSQADWDQVSRVGHLAGHVDRHGGIAVGA